MGPAGGIHVTMGTCCSFLLFFSEIVLILSRVTYFTSDDITISYFTCDDRTFSQVPIIPFLVAFGHLYSKQKSEGGIY